MSAKHQQTAVMALVCVSYNDADAGDRGASFLGVLEAPFGE